MKQMLVRNIEDETLARFQNRARSEGKSAEQALRDLISQYAKPSRDEALRTLDSIRVETIASRVVDPVTSMREDRDTDHGRI